MTDPHERRLRGATVQTLLDASPEALECLVRHGFTPLSNAAMRRALAPTVTLDGAMRLRGLSRTQADALLHDLAEVCPCP